MGIQLFNLTDINNPVTLSSLKYDGDANSIIELHFTLRIFGIASGYQGIVLVNYTDFSNPYVISKAAG